jgi:hypothetical protein
MQPHANEAPCHLPGGIPGAQELQPFASISNGGLEGMRVLWGGFTLRRTAVLVLSTLLLAGAALAQGVPGTAPADLAKSLANREFSSATSLSLFYSASGKIYTSVDAAGSNQVSHVAEVNKPSAVAKVKAAYVLAASMGFTGRTISNSDVSISPPGATITWTSTMASTINSNNYLADVTSLLAPIIDAAPAGRIPFTFTEVATSTIDGEILVVVFDDPTQVKNSTALLLFGAQNIAGDSFAITLGEPIDPAAVGAVLDMGLGISYGYQTTSTQNQISRIDVNGMRLTSSAGGADDGPAACTGQNGELITVGGLDDSNANPPDPYSAPTTGCRYDDELYSLLPFINSTTTNIQVNTINPSNDDNIFFGYFTISTSAILGEGIVLGPASAVNPVNTQHTVTATVVDTQGHPVVARTVTFRITSGPNVGLTATASTDASGKASFTYTGNAVGIDTIVASFVDSRGLTKTSDPVTKEWQGQSSQQDAYGFWVFDRGVLRPLVGGAPQMFCIPVALKGVVDADGNAVIDPATGCQKMEYDWTNSDFMWRKTDAYIVQSVTLEKTHSMRKGACSLLWLNDYIRQQGKEKATSQINTCWPLLYEIDGTKWTLSVIYQTNPAKPDPSGRTARVHKERYVWTVDWKAKDFSDFRARLNYFSKAPAGQCELFAVPPAELSKILGLLDGRGCEEFNTLDPGITALLGSTDRQQLQLAADKAAQLESLLDADSCIDPCLANYGMPRVGAIGIINSDQAPVGSVLLSDFYYAANNAGLLQD